MTTHARAFRAYRASRLMSLLTPLCVAALSLGCSSSDEKKNDDTGGTGGTDGSGGSGPSGGPAPTLPSPTGTCPEFHEGRATFTVQGVPRQVQLYVDDAAAAANDGPLVFYWYGTLGQPEQALQALGSDGVAKIKSMGGVVAAPVHIAVAGQTFPWISDDLGDDYALADEIAACAKEKIGIDARHLHSNGFSAGGLFTGQFSFARSNYLASVATYSGGGADIPFADPANLFPAMILFGGPNDMLILSFQDQSMAYKNSLQSAGHFAFTCNHGKGHAIPPDAGPSVVQFFLDHPYEASPPDPYEAGLPAGFPSYCSL